MKKEKKWKYSDKKFNPLILGRSSTKHKKLLKVIEQSQQKDLKETLDNALNYRYDIYKKYLLNNLPFFKGLEDDIKESVYCLMIGANTASITNTNLLLEKAIKLALTLYDAGQLIDYEDEKIIAKYLECYKKFASKNIDKNIQTCLKYNILNKDEAEELKEYKIKFRDGFSHFTPNNILKGEKSLVHIPGKIQYPTEQMLKLPTEQAAQVRQFAHNKAEKHLQYTLKVINHIHCQVWLKFSTNAKTLNQQKTP